MEIRQIKRLLKRSNKTSSQTGFTLVEILVAITLSGVVMAGIYSAYYTQQKSYEVQEQVVAVQQNLRAAMYYMERDIRMAGLDPSRNAGAAITVSNPTMLSFTADFGDGAGGDPDGDIDSDEDITYMITGTDLTRTAGGGAQTIATNIDVLDFIYLDADGDITTVPTEVASVQIAMIGRSEKMEPSYTSGQTFQNLQGTTIGSYSDNYRHELLTTQVTCRNIGLQD